MREKGCSNLKVGAEIEMNMHPQIIKPTPCLLALLALLNVFGCAGYRVGSMLPPQYKTVAVPTFENTSEEPLIQNEATMATISQIQFDGSLRISDMDSADSILRVTLTNFSMRPIRFSDDRARLANEYRMEIRASMVLLDRVTGEVIVEADRLRGEADFIVAGDMTSSKQSALPEAMSDLARRIVERMVEVW